MRANVLADLEQRVLADLVHSFAETHAAANQRSSLKKPVRQVAPAGESLCSYLRSIRHWVVTREVAVLLHCHAETIYKRVKIEGLPAHRDGRTLSTTRRKLRIGLSDETENECREDKYEHRDRGRSANFANARGGGPKGGQNLSR